MTDLLVRSFKRTLEGKGLIFICVSVIVILFSLAMYQPGSVNAGDLIIEISELRNTKGEILIAVFDQAEGFPEDESKFFRADTIRNISGTTVRSVIQELEFGDFAITLMHDENVDGAMEYNKLGMPKEGYGFSTNYKPVFRAPKFEETSFQFTKQGQVVRIKMVY